MPPLDHATLQAVLDKQGMPNTTENLNRIAQFAAVAPDMLDKYLGRGTDQSYVDSNVNNAITKSIASTDAAPAADPRLAALAGPNPYTATLDPNTGMSNIGPGLVRTPEPRAGGGGVRPSPNRGRSGAAGATEPDVPPQPYPQPQAQGNNLEWLLPSILPALKYLADKAGANAAGGGARPPAPGGPWEGTPGMPPPEPQGRLPGPAPQRALPAPNEQQRLPAPGEENRPQLPRPGMDNRAPGPEELYGKPTNAPQQAPAPPDRQTNRQTPADIEKLKAEVAAENEAAARAQEEGARKLRAQMNARETLKAAGRVFRK